MCYAAYEFLGQVFFENRVTKTGVEIYSYYSQICDIGRIAFLQTITQRLSAVNSPNNTAGSQVSSALPNLFFMVAYQAMVKKSPGEVYAALFVIKQMLVKSKLDTTNVFMSGVDNLENCLAVLDKYMAAIERNHSVAAQDVKKDLSRSREELSTSSASVVDARVANSAEAQMPVSSVVGSRPYHYP